MVGREQPKDSKEREKRIWEYNLRCMQQVEKKVNEVRWSQERMGRKENKETNTHTPMPRHAQEKKKTNKKQERRKEKQYCPRSEG